MLVVTDVRFLKKVRSVRRLAAESPLADSGVFGNALHGANVRIQLE